MESAVSTVNFTNKSSFVTAARQEEISADAWSPKLWPCCLPAFGKARQPFSSLRAGLSCDAVICQGRCILQGVARRCRGAVEECCGSGWGRITLPSIIIILRRCHRCQFPSGEKGEKKGQYNTVLLRYEGVLTFRNIETY